MSCRKYYDGICQGGICEKCIDDPKNEHVRRRRTIRNTLLFMSIIMIVGLALVMLSGDGEARLAVWDGDGADALASNPLNWDTDTAPVAGDNILFDGLNATGDDACTWDLATNSFGTFTIGSGYSGVITQSSDMYIQGYSQSGGTFTGVTTKWVYCNGSASSTSAFTPGVSNFKLILDGSTTFNLNCKVLQISANVSGYVNSRGLLIDSGKTLTLTSDSNVYCYAGFYGINNNGVITGNKILAINLYDTSAIQNTNIGTATVLKLVISTADVSSARTLTITSNIICNSIEIKSSHAQTNALNLNGHSLTATTITVGTRGILSNSAATDSVVACNNFDSSAGTFNHAGIILQMNGGTLTSVSGEQFETLLLNGTVDLVNSVNITEDMRFINVDPSYGDIDVYLDTVYNSTIASPYSFGIGIQIGASYSYLPDVQIKMSQFYEDIDFSIYAYITTNLPVTYNITGTASSWLTYHEGRITGMPPEIGNYTYTITATHESGSVDIVNGYILVGSLSTPEYSYDQVWGLMLWLVITAFMLIGLLLNIPLIQIVAFMGTIGSIVASLRIPEFEVFLMIFALGNSALFFIGMVRYRR